MDRVLAERSLERRPLVRRRQKVLPEDKPVSPEVLYGALRVMELSPSLQHEFGVRTNHDLARRLNECWHAEGRLPLTQGSFPTNRSTVRSAARLLREALAQQSGRVASGS